MAFTINTTHAVPQKLLPAPIHIAHAKLTICSHCFQVLGTCCTPAERRALEAGHVCKEKLDDQRPAAALPFH